jgi:hypothetical protein
MLTQGSRWPGRAAVLAAACVLSYQLMFPPRVGLANNGDFEKIAALFNIAAIGGEYQFANLKYPIDAKYHWESGHYSSETLLTALAVGLNRVFGNPREFDMRWMGAVHGFLFLLAIYLLQPLLAGKSKLFVNAGTIFLFADYMYTSQFNTFYMDASAYVFLMLTIVLFLRAAKWHRMPDSIALLASSLLLVLSKPQHAILGIWIVLVFAVFGAALWPRHGRALSLLSAALVAAAVSISPKLAPVDYGAHGYYTVIFLEVLPHSSNVDRDLKALGLDASYKPFIGTHAYSQGNGMADAQFREQFMRRTSYARLGWFFFTHPRQTLLALDISLGQAGLGQPAMGNFDPSGGFPAGMGTYTFALWSRLKSAVFHRHGIRYLFWWILVSAFLFATATVKRDVIPRIFLPGAYALCGMAITAMLVASLADAVDQTRHHIISNALLDLELLSGIALAAIARPMRPPTPKIRTQELGSHDFTEW